MANRGRCGAARGHAVHIKALGLPDYHDWESCKVPNEPKKRKPIAPRSEKMAEFYEEHRRPTVELVLIRDNYECQIMSPWHERIADWNPATVHEIASRGREGGIMAEGVNDPANCVTACLRCNQAMQENPDWAEEHGWLKPASAVI